MAYPKKPERKLGETDSDFSARIEAWIVRLEAAKEKARKYYTENAEREREYQRKYRAERLEQCREYARKYRAERLEQCREYARKYRAERLEQFREREREYARKYRAERLEQCREYARKYRAEHLAQFRERERERYAKKLGLSRVEYLKNTRHARGVKASLGEDVVCCYLESVGIKFEREKTFDWLRNSETGRRFRCDFYLPDLGTVIEYNGPQHYGYRIRGCFKPEDIARRMVMDVEKAEKIIAHGLRLIAIPGDEIRKAGQIRRYLARELASDGWVDSK